MRNPASSTATPGQENKPNHSTGAQDEFTSLRRIFLDFFSSPETAALF